MMQQTDKAGNTLLHYAASGANHRLLCAVVREDGYDINVKNYKGETPLDIARKHGRVENEIELLRHGARNHCDRCRCERAQRASAVNCAVDQQASMWCPWGA
jgi:ankyrin repeat protein